MTNDHIISHLCGGLGNQMFQHATGRALALRHGVEFLWDISWYDCMGGCTPRSFMLPLFPALGLDGARAVPTANQACVAALKHCPQALIPKVWRKLQQCFVPNIPTHIMEPHGHYWEKLLSIVPPVYIQGYWQDERYFAEYAQEIAADFAFPPLPSGTCGIAQDIQSAECAVSVHIRRGDYVHSVAASSVHGTCSTSYYNEAFTKLKNAFSHVHLYLFSDEPLWVREYFDTQGLPKTVVDNHAEVDALHGIHLMTLCKHHVIANSSFSWWGAWLAKAKGVTIGPKLWFSEASLQYQNPCPERWVVL